MRHAGLHARRSYKSTRNVGKLLKEAGQQDARIAIILGGELHEGIVSVKDLGSGDQQQVSINDLETVVHQLLAAQ